MLQWLITNELKGKEYGFHLFFNDYSSDEKLVTSINIVDTQREVFEHRNANILVYLYSQIAYRKMPLCA